MTTCSLLLRRFQTTHFHLPSSFYDSNRFLTGAYGATGTRRWCWLGSCCRGEKARSCGLRIATHSCYWLFRWRSLRYYLGFCGHHVRIYYHVLELVQLHYKSHGFPQDASVIDLTTALHCRAVQGAGRIWPSQLETTASLTLRAWFAWRAGHQYLPVLLIKVVIIYCA